MENEKKLQAKNLYFQTSLTKTEIAEILNISRRSLSYWVREGEWNRLKESAKHLPAMLAENCYHMIAHLQEHYLSEQRITNRVSSKEIDALHKLTLTANKLSNRCTLNESMELLGFFMEMLRNKNGALADQIMPYVDEYMTTRAGIRTQHIQPDHFNHLGRIPWKEDHDPERIIDNQEAYFDDPDTAETYAQCGIPFPSEEEISIITGSKKAQPPQQLSEENITVITENEAVLPENNTTAKSHTSYTIEEIEKLAQSDTHFMDTSINNKKIYQTSV